MNNDYNIYTANLLRTLPEALKKDESLLALAQVIAEEKHKTLELIEQNVIYARIDELQEDALDVLSYPEHANRDYSGAERATGRHRRRRRSGRGKRSCRGRKPATARNGGRRNKRITICEKPAGDKPAGFFVWPERAAFNPSKRNEYSNRRQCPKNYSSQTLQN